MSLLRTAVPLRAVFGAQGVLYTGTGLWALLHLPSFLAVTGPKHDTWLVRTVGALVSVIGAVLLLGAVRGRSLAEGAVLGVGCAAALGTVDAVYAGKRRISPVYLLDAVAELLLLVAYALSFANGRRFTTKSRPRLDNPA